MLSGYRGEQKPTAKLGVVTFRAGPEAILFQCEVNSDRSLSRSGKSRKRYQTVTQFVLDAEDEAFAMKQEEMLWKNVGIPYCQPS